MKHKSLGLSLILLILFKSCMSLSNIEYADNLYKEGRYYEALYYFVIELNSNPGSYEAHLGRGKCFLLLGRYEEAVTEFSLASGRRKTGEVFYQRALGYFYSNKLTNALTDLDESLKLDSLNPDAYFTRGYIYSISGEYEKSLADYTTALQLKPDWVEALVNRGNIYSITGFSRQAIDDFTNAIKSDPLNSNAYLNRANEFAISGSFQDALKDYNVVLKLQPSNQSALELRAETYKFLGLTDSAVTDYSVLLQLNPERADIYFERGKLFLQREKLSEACKDLMAAGMMGYYPSYELINKYCK
ncbi:MAG: hypothetical protein Kow0098_22110 [Ignavibacteriaceae bacterium]